MATNAWNIQTTSQQNAPAVEQPMPVTRSRREIIDPDDIVGYYKTYRGTTADEEAPEVARSIEAGMKEMRKVGGSRKMTFNEYKNLVESVASGLNLPFPEWTEQAKARLFTRGIDAGFGKMAEDEAKRKEERIKMEEEAASKYELTEELSKKYGRAPPREMTAQEKQDMDLTADEKKAQASRSRAEKTISELVKKTPGTALGYDMDGNPKLIPASLLTRSDASLLSEYKVVRAKPQDGVIAEPPIAQPAAQPIQSQPTGVRFWNQDKSASVMVSDPAMIERFRDSGKYTEE